LEMGLIYRFLFFIMSLISNNIEIIDLPSQYDP
jgi:hypothetical protein